MLLSNLNLIASAPNGVARLRELILTLAVQGKLVPQNPQDEPASELLKRIRVEKDKLIAEGKIKRDKPLSPITDKEKPFELPEGWELCKLSDIFLSIRSGGTPSKQNPTYWNGSIPWASVKDLRFGDPISDTQDRITEAGLSAGSELALAGSILICTRMGLGKIGETLIDVAINQDLKAVLLGNGVNKQFFINFFKTLALVGSGMTVAGIKQDELLSLVIPLPPESEQSRIVTRVEELMRLCDALENNQKLESAQHAQLVRTLLDTLTASTSPEELAQNWERVATHFDLLFNRPAAVDALEQTILQLAVRGLLVPQNTEDEPASVLLKRIRVEKDKLIAEGKIKRDKPLAPITDKEKPFELPEGWEWVKLPEVTYHLGQCAPNEDFTYIDIAAIDNKKAVIIDNPEILEAANAPSRARKNVALGTVLYSTVRPYLKNIAIIEKNYNPRAIASTAFAVMQPHIGLDSKYLLNYLRSEVFTDFVSSRAVGVAYPAINDANFFEGVIPLPPLAEQSRIVARVEQLRQLCAQLRGRLVEGQKVQEGLAGWIVTT